MRPLARVLLVGTLMAAVCAGPAGARAGLRVRGNQLVVGNGRGQVVQLRGVNRSGLEYACVQGWGLFDSPHPDQIDSTAMVAAMTSWEIDVVRVPLNEDCWLGLMTKRGLGGRAYRRIVEAYVHELVAAHLFVILDLHWAAPGRARATGQLPMADADHAPAFWRSVARTFRADDDVIFDLFNEPFGISWRCWLHGCHVGAGSAGSTSWPAYRTAGMQALVDAVRSRGARQPLLLGGLGYASDLSGWARYAPHDPLHQLIAAQHNYGGLSPCGAACLGAIGSTHRRYPVLMSELGETDCAHGYLDQMMSWADQQGIGYLGWAWDATSPGGWTCDGGPSLITSYDGAPTPFGIGLRDHLRGLGPAVPAPALP